MRNLGWAVALEILPTRRLHVLSQGERCGGGMRLRWHSRFLSRCVRRAGEGSMSC